MKSVGFVGKMNCSGMVLCVARLLEALNKKVIYIDATENQRARYTVPIILSANKQEQYVTQYDRVEVAVRLQQYPGAKKIYACKR